MAKRNSISSLEEAVETVAVVVDDTSPQPARLPSPADQPQSITLAAYARQAFKTRDQAVPFERWAAKSGHARHSVAEWTAILRDFNSRPVGG